MTGAAKCVLSKAHKKMLSEGSAISEEVLRSRGYWTATGKGELRALGFADYQCKVPALVIPIHGVDGELASYRIRPDDPRPDKHKQGKTVKYEQPDGTKIVIDVPPSTLPALHDTSKPLYIVEGEKKADCLSSLGVPVVGLLGVWGWKYDGKPRPDWDRISLVGRKVYVVFDSDVATNVNVRTSEKQLARYLETRGATVRVVRLPSE